MSELKKAAQLTYTTNNHVLMYRSEYIGHRPRIHLYDILTNFNCLY